MLLSPVIRFPRRLLTVGALLLTFQSPLLLPSQALADVMPQSQSQSLQPYLDQAIANVTEFQLDNGLKFIVMENHDAPVVSFYTLADVGGADEPEGKTGVAHFLEHMAFKGTDKIGTKNFAQEQILLDQLDQAFNQLKAAKPKETGDQ